MFDFIFVGLKQKLCFHKNCIKKRKPIEGTDLYQLYTECLDCGYESPGIETGGFYGTKINGRQVITA